MIATNNIAYQLTAYERYGVLSQEDLKEYYADNLYFDSSIIPEYNEYLIENGFDEYIDFDLLDDYLYEMTPIDILRLGYFSFDLFNREYVRFDGYGNLVGYDSYEIVREAEEDQDFKVWYLENYFDMPDESEIEAILQEANELIRKGY